MSEDGDYKQIAFWVPGALVFFFVLAFSHLPLLDRLAVAVFVGFAAQMVFALGMVGMSVLADKLLGLERKEPRLPNARDMLAGILLATAVWMVWQFNRDQVVSEVAVCVDGMHITHCNIDVVLECYRHRGDYDDWEESD